ncbi:MAG: hypothetical protein IJS05_02245 [Paludibacteraceae bacterium]|nr:hypothetical protein [Paludibacteraceae bacterium]
MKKFYLILALVIVSASAKASDYENEVSISGGPFTPVTLATQYFSSRIIGATPLADLVSLENPKFYGSYQINYNHQMNDWFQLGAKVGWTFTGFDLYSTDKDPQVVIALGKRKELLGQSATHIITAMISAQFTYFNTDMVELYSGIDLGAGVAVWNRKNMYSKPILNPLNNPDLNRLKEMQEKYKDGTDLRWIPAANITLFGVTFGSRVYGLAEINVGLDALVKVGIGFRR